MKISKILSKYDTDKVRGHCYGGAYNKIFGGFDKNKKLNILEIGVEKGGSLMAWAEYFPNARIYGIDIVDVRKLEYRSNRVTFILSDMRDVKLDTTFDIIIDDGSHLLSDALVAVKKFLPMLNPGGVMVVEDVQHPKSWVWGIAKIAGISRVLTGRFFFKDMRKISGGFDDFLIIIKK
ncbi:MAG: class I SAM-dependent methyltransferase [Candidatus Vogelbacteria bacterium]|nr:class I SAM-dependent methyltransferase [Candidatus Vogelbacteria bacterium]